jgi:hypothetical protein
MSTTPRRATQPTREQIAEATAQVDLELLAKKVAALLAEDLRLAEVRRGPVRPVKGRRR